METRVAYFGGPPQTIHCAITRQGGTEPFRIRIQFGCSHGTVFRSEDCDCGDQVNSFLASMARSETNSALLYFADHEAYGAGPYEKMKVLDLEERLGLTYAELERSGKIRRASFDVIEILPFLLRKLDIDDPVILDSKSDRKRAAVRKSGVEILDTHSIRDNRNEGLEKTP